MENENKVQYKETLDNVISTNISAKELKEEVEEQLKMFKSNNLRNKLIGYLIALIIGIIVGWAITYNFYDAKLKDVTEQLNEYKAKYSTVQKEKEDAIIAKALADHKAKTPVKEYIKGDTITTVEYVEKESAKDADLSITNPPTKVVMEYNGEKQELQTINSEGKVFKDGKWIIKQESQTVLNVDDIVNRQIAITIEEKEHQKKVLQRQKIQNGIWGLAIGYGIGKNL